MGSSLMNDEAFNFHLSDLTIVFTALPTSYTLIAILAPFIELVMQTLQNVSLLLDDIELLPSAG